MKKNNLAKNKIFLGALGAISGFLALWIVIKVSKPAIRKVCTYVLQEEEDEQGLGGDRRAATVEVFKTKIGVMTKRVKTMGRLVANQSVLLKSEIQGTIQSIPFKEGDQVNQGDILIEFDNAGLQAELKTAEAEYELTKADFDRKKALIENKITSSSDFQKSQAQFKIAEGKLEALKARLQKTIIRAPFGGIAGLIESGVGLGSYVQPGTELLTLVNNDPMFIEFKVPEKNIQDIGAGQMAEISVDGISDQKFWATVDAIDSKIDSASRTLRVKGSIANKDDFLRSGQFARVSLVIGENKEAIVIPENAVQRLGEREFVWFVNNGVAKKTAILTGAYENGMVEVQAGLKEDILVITSGQIHLRDEQPIIIKNKEEIDKEVPKAVDKAADSTEKSKDNAVKEKTGK